MRRRAESLTESIEIMERFCDSIRTMRPARSLLDAAMMSEHLCPPSLC